MLREVDLTVVEMGPRMVPRMLGEKAGDLLKTWCESKGVTVHTGTTVEQLSQPRMNSTSYSKTVNRVLRMLSLCLRV